MRHTGVSRDDGAAERHSLLLAAGELGGLAREQSVEAEEIGHAGESRRALGRRHRRTRRPNTMFSATDRCGKSA